VSACNEYRHKTSNTEKFSFFSPRRFSLRSLCVLSLYVCLSLSHSRYGEKCCRMQLARALCTTRRTTFIRVAQHETESRDEE
jgi:hypothetical protein